MSMGIYGQGYEPGWNASGVSIEDAGKVLEKWGRQSLCVLKNDKGEPIAIVPASFKNKLFRHEARLEIKKNALEVKWPSDI